MGVGDLGDGDAEQQDGPNKLQGDKLDGLADKANGITGGQTDDQTEDQREQREQRSGEQGTNGD